MKVWKHFWSFFYFAEIITRLVNKHFLINYFALSNALDVFGSFVNFPFVTLILFSIRKATAYGFVVKSKNYATSPERI